MFYPILMKIGPKNTAQDSYTAILIIFDKTNNYAYSHSLKFHQQLNIYINQKSSGFSDARNHNQIWQLKVRPFTYWLNKTAYIDPSHNAEHNGTPESGM